MMESLEDASAAFIPDGETAETAEPCQGTLDDPAMPPQALGAVDPAAGNPRLDRAPAQRRATMPEVVALVGMELGRSPLRSTNAMADRRHGIDHLFEEAAVVDVCRAEPDGEWNALSIRNQVALGAGSAAIGWVGAGLLAPLLAGTDALSTQARLQSMAPARPRRSSRTRCSFFQTPAACQSRSRRQHVMPDPQPISWGSISQGTPLFSTNRMPVNAARCGIGGRPPFGFGRSGGNSGSIKVHNSLDTRGLAMPPRTARSSRRSGFC